MHFPRADELRHTAENTAGNAILSILFSDSPLGRTSRHPEAGSGREWTGMYSLWFSLLVCCSCLSMCFLLYRKRADTKQGNSNI